MAHATLIMSFTDDIEPWMIWGYYASPMMYGQNAIAINEFLDERWSTVRSLTYEKKTHHDFISLQNCIQLFII
jgi:hypothetical protein